MARESKEKEKKNVRITAPRRPGKRTDEKASAAQRQAQIPPDQGQDVKPISKRNQWKLMYAQQPPQGNVAKDSITAPSFTRIEAETKEAAYLGLCMSCLKIDHCVLPKPEGGLWRCAA